MKNKLKVTRNELIFYIASFIVFLLLGLMIMSSDNISWITASPEWDSEHTVCNNLDCWTGAVKDYSFGEKLDYVFKYRIYTVFTHPRDLIPLSIYALLITFGIFVSREFMKGNFRKKIKKWLNS